MSDNNPNPALDGIVEGTAGNDLIDGAYTGDPEGDMVDNADAIDPAAGPDDDVIVAGSGDDSVYAGSGSDTVDGGSGDDLILGDGVSGSGEPVKITISSTSSAFDNKVFAYTIDPATGEISNVVMLSEEASADVGETYLYHAPEGAVVGVGIVSPQGTFYSSGYGSNAGLNPDGLDHTKGIHQFPDGSVQLGFEDLRNLGDRDFNDVKLIIDLGSSGTTLDNAHYDYSSDPRDPVVPGDDSLTGGEGDDTILGGGGDDTIDGGDGSDSVDGGDGDDVIDTSKDSGVPLPDRGFPGYTGTDPDIPFIPADPDPFDDMDTVFGGAGNDTISTGDDADLIGGGAGMDVIDGGIDDDTIDGGTGDDLLIGGEGADMLAGGAGDDTIYGGLDPAFPDGLNITDDGSDGRPADPDPTNGRDTIFGGSGNDLIFGQDDDDVISGGSGDDTIDAGIDDDEVRGGSGNDVIIGGHGADTLLGGADRDTFIGGNDGDIVDGGSDGDDFDTLDMRGSGRFELSGVTVDPDGNSLSGTVNFLDGDGEVTGSMTFGEIEQIIPCFTPGTLIATPLGERKVEDLQAGDRVITRDNGIQEIRWIGTRTLEAGDLKGAAHLQPVLIRQGALGNGLPERDMMVSPNHRVLVANDKTALYFEDREVLVAAKHLTGLAGVDAVEVSSVTYIHFMFDQHEVVLSDGAWTESFQPGDQSLRGLDNAQRNELFELFPELKSQKGRAAYSAARRSLRKHEAHLLVH
ncbi:Hint domain-containing protein [Leisingera daeponensis]|uniref:Hint domain-containing protein n=1 Tax=Leisingera daeponensis TaxID=405746 RepID=A0ABS7NAB1_9RHOB|nr:Hint domain-containing protein [Leisingera daeponensis]MBY6138139.1 Hint domain-containing protein [Leisingera daeponensis]